MCYLCTEMANMGEMTQKYGYLDVKQSSKVRGRKLKTWRRKWVVFTKMSDLSSCEVVGKLDLYESEEKWKSSARNKLTFIFEHVTSVRRASSRTHPYAFEIVDKQPTFVLSGTTEMESYSWFLTLQRIFTPEMVESTKESYIVVIHPNEASRKWKLDGEYRLNVSRNGISLIERDDQISTVKISWGLSTLKRFDTEQMPKSDEIKILSIKCGPNSPTGECTFKFLSDEVHDIIKTIRHNICVALADKQNIRREGSNRIRSISATFSEDNFMTMLDHQSVSQDQFRDRSGSDSSDSTLSPTPSSVSGIITCDPLVRSDSFFRTVSLRSNPTLEVLDEVEEHNTDRIVLGEKDRQDSGCCSEIVSFESHGTSGSWASEEVKMTSCSDDHGYSVIKDVTSATDTNTDPIYHVPKKKTEDEMLAQKVTAQVSEELILPGSFAGHCHEFGTENKLESSDSKEKVNWPSTSSLERKSEKKTDLVYQEIGKVGKMTRLSDFPTSPGNLDRRRSSSTPDLQAFWKMHGFDTDFENIYEELDEHRRLFFSRPQNKKKDIPPALPARPFMINFSTAPKENGNQPVVRLKKSFLGRSKERRQNSESKTAGQKVKTCSCHSPKRTKRKNNSKKSTCNECGGEIKSEPTKAAFQCPALAENLSSNNNRNNNSPKTSQAEMELDGQTGKSSPTFGHETGILIDIDSDDVASGSDTPPIRYDTPATRPCSKNDPLIGFFLDDHTFDTNPLVTGEWDAKPTSSNSTKCSKLMNSTEQSFHRLPLTHQRSLPIPLQASPALPIRQRAQTNSPPNAAAFMNEAFLVGAWATSADSYQSESLATISTNPFESGKDGCSPAPGANNTPPFSLTFPDFFSTQTCPIFPTSASSNSSPPDTTYMAMSNRSKLVQTPETATTPFNLNQGSVPSSFPFDPFMSIRDEKRQAFDMKAKVDFSFTDTSNSVEKEANSNNIYVTPGWSVH